MNVGRLAEGQEMHDLGVGELARAPGQGAHQLQRLAAAGADEDALAGAELLHRLVGRGDHRSVFFLPVGVVARLAHGSLFPAHESVIRASATQASEPTSPTMKGLMSSSAICG